MVLRDVKVGGCLEEQSDSVIDRLEWDRKLRLVLSKVNFSCLCHLVENTELKKLDGSLDYCMKLKILLSVIVWQDSQAACWYGVYKQIALSLFFLNTIMHSF